MAGPLNSPSCACIAEGFAQFPSQNPLPGCHLQNPALANGGTSEVTQFGDSRGVCPSTSPGGGDGGEAENNTFQPSQTC